MERYHRALFRFCVVDPVFTADEVDALFAEKNAAVISRILDAIKALNGATEEAATAAADAFPPRPAPGDPGAAGPGDGRA
jgi:hypothetical protein